jgi:uncharacterized protein YjiS (DUF1127 family)
MRMAAFHSWRLRREKAGVCCSAQRLETLLTEQNRKDTDMTTAIAAKSGAGFLLAGAERTAGTLAETISGTWTDYRTYRATLAELKRLTTRQLNDAGLSRADLRRIAFEAVYGR